MAYESAAKLLNDVAVELGLSESYVADPYSATDPVWIQLRKLLAAAGRELVLERDWSHLRTDNVITTVVAQSAYSLGAGYSRMVGGSVYNGSTHFPMIGPVPSRAWARLKNTSVTSATYYFRARGSFVDLYPAPKSVQTIRFEFISSFWVAEVWDGSFEPNRDEPSDPADELWFEPFLLGRLLKVKWQEAKGFDSTAARQDYESALDKVASADSPGAILPFSGGRDVRFISHCNTPDGGWGKV